MNRVIGLMMLGILTMMVSALPAEEEQNTKEHYAVLGGNVSERMIRDYHGAGIDEA